MFLVAVRRCHEVLCGLESLVEDGWTVLGLDGWTDFKMQLNYAIFDTDSCSSRLEDLKSI